MAESIWGEVADPGSSSALPIRSTAPAGKPARTIPKTCTGRPKSLATRSGAPSEPRSRLLCRPRPARRRSPAAVSNSDDGTDARENPEDCGTPPSGRGGLGNPRDPRPRRHERHVAAPGRNHDRLRAPRFLVRLDLPRRVAADGRHLDTRSHVDLQPIRVVTEGAGEAVPSRRTAPPPSGSRRERAPRACAQCGGGDRRTGRPIGHRPLRARARPRGTRAEQALPPSTAPQGRRRQRSRQPEARYKPRTKRNPASTPWKTIGIVPPNQRSPGRRMRRA